MIGEGILLVISGPSGSGKGTVVEEIAKNENYALSISATTRKPRNYEKHGEHYFFCTKDEFKELIKNNMLLEWAEFCGDYYGTPKEYVEKSIKKGENIILEIEVQGALQIKKLLPDSVLIFVMPPTVEELRNRLVKRGTETEELIEKRIKRSNEEITLISNYDYVVINNEIEDAVKDILAIARAERLKTYKNTEAIKKFKGEI